jgi:lysophospholipase L1-like esterase
MKKLLASLNPLKREAMATLVILAVLFGIASVSPSAYRYRPREDTTIKKVLRTLQKRGLNRDATAQRTAGYYEGLLDQAAEVTRAGGRGWLDWRFWFVDRPRRVRLATQLKRDREDFLRFDLPPNANVPELDERRRLITNSLGMADNEYSQARPARTWRVALIGDSVTRGMGAEFGTSFEARLEEDLNERFAGQGYDRYEILNFGVQGYQLTHLVDVTLDRVPPFSPNLYVVALTDRSVFRVWADHLASVVRNRVDLKYDYLKQIVKEAKVTPNLSEGLINARLSPYRVPVLRWAVAAMQARAQKDGVPLVVLLVPAPDDPELQIEQFQDVKSVLDEMSIPTVDLLETFVDLDDLSPVRVSASDRHPNEAGHAMLFEALLRKIQADPRLMAAFTGGAPGAAPGPPKSEASR